MDHVELVQLAKSAIDKVFSDRSVSRADTKASLTELRDEIDVMMATLEE